MVLALVGWRPLQNKTASNLTRSFNPVVINRMQTKIELRAYVQNVTC